MDCFPGVSFSDDSAVEFTVNFTGWFKFDVTSIPDYRNDHACRLGAAPIEVIAQIFYYAAETPMQVAEWRKVKKISWNFQRNFSRMAYLQLSKKMNEAVSHNIVWKDLYLKKFKKQNPNLKIKSWMKFYKRRVAAKKQTVGPFGSKPYIIGKPQFNWRRKKICCESREDITLQKVSRR